MDLRTTQFAHATGETFATIRGVYGRSRDPRGYRDEKLTPGQHRRYFWADAVAWRVTRDLCDLGMTWDQAAELCREQMVTYQALRFPDDARGKFFAVWGNVTLTTPVQDIEEHSFTAWVGTPAEIAEAVALDASKDACGFENFAGLSGVRMVSLHRAIITAKMLARQAGFDVIDGEFHLIGTEFTE